MHEDAHSLLHNTTSHIQCLYHISKFLRNLTKKILEKKKNGQIKEMTYIRMLILFYMIQVSVPNVCTKFQNPRCSSSLKILNME